MATTVLGLKTFAASDPVDYNEVNDNYVKIDNGVKTAMQGRAAHNLLDNSNFTNPVNQRGQTSYSGNVYTIDRWRLNANTLNVGSNGITLAAGDSSSAVLTQYTSGLRDDVYTQALNVNGTIYTRMIQLSGSTITTLDASNAAYTGGYVSCTVSSSGYFSFQIRANAGYSITVRWAALYEGAYDASTLPAYQPKGYAAELAECQRYFWRCTNTWFAEGSGYAFSNTEYRVSIILPQMMRVTPTMISSTGNTTSYGIKIHTSSGANLTPTAVSLSMKNNRIALTLTGTFTNGELGVLRLENDYLDFSADL